MIDSVHIFTFINLKKLAITLQLKPANMKHLKFNITSADSTFSIPCTPKVGQV
jgi:hypothetical protein